MATSATEICNIAISWVAGNRLTSLDDDDSTEAILCRANYDASRKATLESREWTFAQKRARLNHLVETPSFGFRYLFALPADCLRVNSVETSRNKDIIYVVEDSQILSDESELDIKYTFNQKNTNKFSALFTEALGAHIAAKICVPLTESRTLMADLLQLFGDMIQEATAADSLQGSRERLKRSQQEKSRRLFTQFD